MLDSKAQEAKVKDQLVAKLKENHLLSDDQMVQFKKNAVKYWREKRSWGHNQQLVLEKEYDEMTLHFFKHAVIGWIENHVPVSRCIQCFEDVMSVLPRDQKYPPRTEPTKREKPETPFSMSRAKPRFVKSNAELIDALASATNMEPSTAIMIRGTIVFADSISGGKHYSSGMFSGGLVSGGRLGRDHMLDDVPNHYVRDRLMDYINSQLEGEDQKERARLAVFTDLSPAEIKEYSALIVQWVKKNQPKTTEELITLVAGDKPIRTESERWRVIDQGQALEGVYLDVDLASKPGFAKRTYSRPGPIIHSVVEPGQKTPTPAEQNIDPGTDIDKDCDQIRAMIAMFAFKKEWTVDQFRLALGYFIERKDLTKFLCQDGPRKGIDNIFQLAWEFFKRRELLGLPLTETPDNGNVLQESHANANTRKRVYAGENTRVTRSKSARKSN
ncbi:hypothetical protein F5B19DRAFT_502590 [Rostrohypoxylon terebratum]|nr:hypothetical protein F5B19DRAFT_502590 [Rostrohypoxylon terebratum]